MLWIKFIGWFKILTFMIIIEAENFRGKFIYLVFLQKTPELPTNGKITSTNLGFMIIYSQNYHIVNLFSGNK